MLLSTLALTLQSNFGSIIILQSVLVHTHANHLNTPLIIIIIIIIIIIYITHREIFDMDNLDALKVLHVDIPKPLLSSLYSSSAIMKLVFDYKLVTKIPRL
jgi:hypothetical protein